MEIRTKTTTVYMCSCGKEYPNVNVVERCEADHAQIRKQESCAHDGEFDYEADGYGNDEYGDQEMRIYKHCQKCQKKLGTVIFDTSITDEQAKAIYAIMSKGD